MAESAFGLLARATAKLAVAALFRDTPRRQQAEEKTMRSFKAICEVAAPAAVALLLQAQIKGTPQSNSGAAASGARRAVIVQTASRVIVDGVLHEPDWAQATPIGEILQREPKPGDRATERTEVKLLYDHQNLYVGVMCYDSEPGRIIGTQMGRDADLTSDDRIEVLLDTFRDRRNAFYFATNPAGALVDGLIIENGQPSREWDGIWTVRTRRVDGGWSAEFALPFKSLGFHQGEKIWGFNFSRTIQRKLEEDRWAAPRLDVKFYQVSEAGEIDGLDGLEQGRGLDVRPFLAGKWSHDQTGDDTLTGKGGVDIFYNITPNLKWASTFNTDFAETEVDSRQINLTRFPLFFPEKRAFFLENAGVFNFSNFSSFSRSPDLIPFFSRRIGLLSGEEVPILAGTKLTGKARRYDLGVLGARTRETGLVEARNFFVGRVKRNLFKQSYVGGLYTQGHPAQPITSRTYGGDVRLATSHFLGKGQNFAMDAYVLRSGNEGVKGDDRSYGFTLRYPNDLVDASIEWKHIGAQFNPALGFVSRRDVNKLMIAAEYDPRPKNFLNVRQMFHEFFFTRYTRLSTGEVESWRVFTAPINWRLNSGDRLEFNWVPTFERLFEPFEISKGVVLPKGDYRFTRWRAEFGTASKRRWKVDGTWWFGTFYSGHSNQVELSFQYKVAPHLNVSLGLDQTFVRLKEGHFVARIFELRASYAFSPFLSISNLVQFDNESRHLGWQSRIRWIIRPGNDLFLVFNQGWLQDERGGFNFRSAGTKLTGKLQYTFRF
jgi:hypothetical protein